MTNAFPEAETPETDAVLRIADNYGAIRNAVGDVEDGVTPQEAHETMVASLIRLARKLERKIAGLEERYEGLVIECAKERGMRVDSSERAASARHELLAAEAKVAGLEERVRAEQSQKEYLNERLNEMHKREVAVYETLAASQARAAQMRGALKGIEMESREGGRWSLQSINEAARRALADAGMKP